MEIEMDTSARTTDALDTASEKPLPLPGTEAYESLPQFPKGSPLPFRRTIRKHELRQIVPLAESTIYEMERRGEFPRRFNLTPRCVVWDLAEVEAWCARQGGLGKGMDALLTLLDTRFLVTHRKRFVSATLAERQQFLESLTGIQGNLLQGLSAPFRMAQLQDNGVLARLGLPNGVRVPASIESARWRQQITDVDQLDGDDTLEADVVIIGTGAGGAAAALELASQGLAVVVLEEGRYHDRRDFTGRLTEMVPMLYRAMGLTAAIGNTVIPVPIGRNVGGTTTINSGTAMAAPPATLARWRASGLRDFTDAEMTHYNAEVMDIPLEQLRTLPDAP